ncbi:glycosyltransferase, partial [Enterobacter roggenkampii]
MISVLTPTFNRYHTLQRLYDSLCSQNCTNFEWIIIDDGSIDDTEKLVSEFIT